MKMYFLIIIILLSCVLFTSCTNPKSAKKVLEQNGYSNVEITGYNFMACSKEDFYHTGFKAKNIASGVFVEGTVCEGFWFKNSTIRFK